ncbi:DNA polymerase III subunit beta [Candidatus Dojkabacteria bacterium CG_4_9_14_3_um_filter_150_Dojkabacteria_WS6_41_13]|nr:MAG: DNA polymerase III subunit beta [Candidatus Dojkabacteria bacterium CG_4_9_14_3_um_filter_150_Dojkabacteria_WS6_41_13]
MELVISAEVLASYVNIASKVVNSKANLPLLNNLLLEVSRKSIRIVGTDLEIQISATAQVAAKETGKTSVNAKLFSQYINTISKTESVTIKKGKGVLKVSSKSGDAEFTTRDVDDFPLFESSEMETLFTLQGEQFASMVDKTIFACAKDDIRPILTGINVEVENDSVMMVALDTFRLSKIIAQSSSNYVGKKQVVIPSVAMEQVVRVIRDTFIAAVTEQPVVTCKLSKNGNFVLLQYGEIEIFARLIEGDYPAYKAVIPVAHQTEVTVSRTLWLESLKRVGVFAQSAIGQKVILNFAENKLTMEALVPEIGNIREEVAVTQEGEPLKIAFQIRFLLDILSLIEDESVIFRASTKVAPGVFLQPSLDSFLHILMPLKLDD